MDDFKFKQKLAVGIMSGTSGDGVSVAIAAFNSKKREFKCLDSATYPYPPTISRELERGQALRAPEISRLNFVLGKLFLNAVLKLLKKNRLNFNSITVIGSHGHTLYHHQAQEVLSSLQIGEAAVIAQKTGIPVVADFRVRDIAAGGEGAPLVPYFDQYFFGRGEIKALQNIGGIANVTVVGKKIPQPIAFDTGPGNCLLDWAVKIGTKNKMVFDRGGKLAAQGEINYALAHKLFQHSYFKRKPPKSTGKELFNHQFLPPELKTLLREKLIDGLATLNYFTAYSIAQSYARFLLNKYPIKEMILSGGGAFNLTLIRNLRNLLPKIAVTTIERYGVSAQAKEPVAFAFFALRAWEGKINHLPSGTGAHGPAILGKISPGRKFRD